jgi:hypothetical protein
MTIYINPSFLIMNNDSSRTFLSTVVQDETTILVFLISLNLIIVQIIYGAYSYFIMDFLLKSKDFVIINILYIGSIIISLFLLRFIESDNIDASSLEYYILLSYLLNISILLSIVPYYFNTFKNIEPFNLIVNFANKIKIENFSILAKPGGRDDPIRPISDLIMYFLKNNDDNLVIEGINSIRSKLIYILNKKNTRVDQDIALADCMHYHFPKIELVSLSNNKLYISELIINILEELGYMASKSRWENVTCRILLSLEEIGSRTTQKQLDSAAHSRAPRAIEKIGLTSIQINLPKCAIQAISSLSKIGLLFAEQSHSSTYFILVYLTNLAIISIKSHNMDKVIYDAVTSIGAIALKATEAKDEAATKQSLFNLMAIIKNLKISEYSKIIKIIEPMIKAIHANLIKYKLDKLVPECEECEKTLNINA